MKLPPITDVNYPKSDGAIKCKRCGNYHKPNNACTDKNTGKRVVPEGTRNYSIFEEAPITY